MLAQLAQLPELPSRPFVLELGPELSGVGFAVDDYAAILEALSELSFPEEPERAVAKRRAEFRAGRLAAVLALERLGLSAAPGRNADGSPLWPARIVGSITHGARRALCAVARQEQVLALGIDAETLIGEEASIDLRRRICTEREVAALESALALSEHELVSLAFSAKESLYKCLFPKVGRFMDFAAAEVVAAVAVVPRHAQLEPGIEGELLLRLTLDWSERFRTGATISARFFIGREHVETLVKLSAD